MPSTPHHFYWDPAKAVSNYRKHRVSFQDALMAIEDPLAVTRHHIDHGRAEERWVTLGEAKGTLLHVVHTLEGWGRSDQLGANHLRPLFHPG